MCRALAYMGTPLPLDDLLYNSDTSLAKQSYAPRLFQYMNLAGCGVAAWNRELRHADEPLLYRSTALPMYDRNLQQLARQVQAETVIAHVRGADYFDDNRALVSDQNLHPFLYSGERIAFAHNGGVSAFPQTKYKLLPHILPQYAQRIEGTTDSEWLYALLLSKLPQYSGEDRLRDGVLGMLKVLAEVREEMNEATASGINLFVSDGDSLVLTRFNYNYGCYPPAIVAKEERYHSLWYTLGTNYGYHEGEWRMASGPQSGQAADSVLVASEPLTADDSTWIEVPEYSLLRIRRNNAGIEVDYSDIDL